MPCTNEVTYGHTKFHQHRCKGGVWDPKTENLAQFLNVNALRRRIPCSNFMKFSAFWGALWEADC